MKVGETYVVNSPENAHIHARKFRIVREQESFMGQKGPWWFSVADDNGEERGWHKDHFDPKKGCLKISK